MAGVTLPAGIGTMPLRGPPVHASRGMARPILLMAAIGLASLAIILGLDMAGMPLPSDIGVLG